MDERTERPLGNLAELAEIGMVLARGVGMQAVAEPGHGDPALAFSRVSKAV